MEAKLKAMFEATVREKRIPGIVAGAWDRTGKPLFHGAYGLTDITNPQSAPMTPSTQLRIHSLTKAFTCVAALQLLEQNKLSLSDPVEKYVPEITSIPVLDSISATSGQPITRPYKIKPTIHMLMTHTAGFTYDFFDPNTLAWRLSQGQEPLKYESPGDIATTFSTPLAHEPGERYTYGANIDWLGFVIEAISGLRIEEYIRQHITEPLGMKHTGPTIQNPGKHQPTHARVGPTEYAIIPNLPFTSDEHAPVRYGGGHYLNSTLDDYATFLITLLNGGTHPVSNIKILEGDTVERYIFTDHLPLLPKSVDGKHVNTEAIGVIPNVIPQVSNPHTLLPGTKKGWSCAFMINLDDVAGGRKKGSASWCGLGNLYAWIDRTEGVVGMVGTSLLPFCDEEVLGLFDEMEGAVYSTQ